MSGLWLPPSCRPAPVRLIRNFGDPWARNVPSPFAGPKAAPNSGGGGGGKGGAALGAPTNLIATGNGSSQIDLTWTDTASAEGGYKIERSANGLTGWTQVGTAAANATSASDTGLSAETTYYYRVRAYNGSRNGAYSAVVSGTTGAAGPPATNLQWWFKADAITGLTDGQTVGTWADSSGNARDLAHGTDTQRPLYKTGIQNGLPVVRFNGADDRLNTATITAIPQPSTVYFVLSVNSTVGPRLFDGVSATRQLAFHNGSRLAIAAISTLTEGSDTALPYPMRIYCCRFNGASSFLRVNGTQTISGNAGSNSQSDIRLGQSQNGTSWLGGDYCEFLFYSEAHDSTQIAAVESYLNTKWAVY